MNVKTNIKKTIFVHNMFWACCFHVQNWYINEQSCVILWVSWCKNKCFWERFTCISGESGSWEQELTTSMTCVSEMLLEVDKSDGTGATTATSLDWNQTINLFLKVTEYIYLFNSTIETLIVIKTSPKGFLASKCDVRN